MTKKLLLCFIVLISFASFAQSGSVNCDIEVLKKIQSDLDSNHNPDFKLFFLAFSKNCSNNVEFKEWSNTLVFELLDKDTKSFLEALSQENEETIKLILKELKNPVTDKEYPELKEKLLSIEPEVSVKEKDNIRKIIAIIYSQQEKNLSYINEASSYSSRKNEWFGNFNNNIISEVIIRPEGTYDFWSRPYLSCFTWHEYNGTWSKINDTITFFTTYEVDEVDISATYSNEKSNDFYMLTFNTDKHSNLQNSSVSVSFIYNFDDNIKTVEKLYIIGESNNLKISYKDVPKRKKLASIEVEFFINENSKRRLYLTEHNTVNVKVNDVPNIINIKVLENPRKDTVQCEYEAIIRNDKLYFISSHRTISYLPDYTTNLIFENEYKLSDRNWD